MGMWEGLEVGGGGEIVEKCRPALLSGSWVSHWRGPALYKPSLPWFIFSQDAQPTGAEVSAGEQLQKNGARRSSPGFW